MVSNSPLSETGQYAVVAAQARYGIAKYMLSSDFEEMMSKAREGQGRDIEVHA